MACVTTWKKTDFAGKYKVVHMKLTYQNADVAGTAVTGLKIIYGYTISPTSIATKYVTGSTVAGGTITLALTNPLAECYCFVTAWGL